MQPNQSVNLTILNIPNNAQQINSFPVNAQNNVQQQLQQPKAAEQLQNQQNNLNVNLNGLNNIN